MAYTFICIICKKKFNTKDKRRKCCSIKCANKYISILKKGKPRSEETKRNIAKGRKGKYGGKNHNRYGIKLSRKTKDKISEKLKKNYRNGYKHPMLGKHHTNEARRKIKNGLTRKFRGEKASNWQGGKTEKGNFLRSLPEYKDWRTKIFERDNYTCQISEQIGGNLVIHHIESFCDNPKKRLNMTNGITITRKLHNKFHKKYGKGNNTKEQLKEFIDGLEK